MNKKNIAIFIILIVAIIGGYYVYSNYISAKGRAWNALQDYLNAARSHDLERLATLSHQLSEACKEPVATDDCNTRMDTVYNFGSPFKRENFVHTWSDPHQIILASDWVLEETEELSARTRSIIYFTVQDGQIKLLSFKPAQGTFIVKDKERPMPEAELLPKLIEYTEDELVSSDVIGNLHSAVFDSLSTQVSQSGQLVKILAWYDNELGYSARMIDVIKKMEKWV